MGLIQAPQIDPLLDDGQLIEVLPQFRAAPMPVSLLYAHRAGLSKRLRALMDWLAEVLAPHLAAGNRPAYDA